MNNMFCCTAHKRNKITFCLTT